MTSRRDFLKKGGMALAGLMMAPKVLLGNKETANSVLKDNKYISRRPPLSERHFVSKSVEKAISQVKQHIKDEKLAWMFENCFPNTLDTTVEFDFVDGKPDTFVITGDIHAMWLRDSSAQVYPYLKFINEDKQLRLLIEGVIRRQTKQILVDPYANAFNKEAVGSKWMTSDTTSNFPKEVYERKWEIDSLCYPIRLAYAYWKASGDDSVFDSQWEQAASAIVKTFKEQQRKEGHGPYFFYRMTDRQGDTLLNGGLGSPLKPVGLICSSFRPSDDATLLGFLIPSNLFAVESLNQMAEILSSVRGSNTLAKECKDLSAEVYAAVQKYGIVEHPTMGKVYAYEVDGFGNHICMDDANVPSLLALPYLCSFIKKNDPIYLNTRKLVWSESNPYFFKGTVGEGIGGPHIGFDYVWPMSIIMKANTSTSQDEINLCIKTLRDTDADTGFMHESFHKDDPTKFTRSWFAWANTLFGELIFNEYHQ